ncbi:unnamed protein product [Rotaria sp. Silwood1]|nr:unnamed protein product [Rotaria sp. Silwood1]CAF1618143.1 unnamed protein product [Rotaria sp. Silwood1]
MPKRLLQLCSYHSWWSEFVKECFQQIVRNYIESNSALNTGILCYEPIDFEEFHKQIKIDLNLKIAFKKLMHCLNYQYFTFTLRSRKGAFTSVMRAKRRHK